MAELAGPGGRVGGGQAPPREPQPDVVVAAAETLRAQAQNDFPVRRRALVFVLLIVTQMAVNWDSGALAAIYGDKSEKGILKEFDLSKWEQGLLASLVYLGLTLGCLLSGPLLHVFRAKHLLQVSLFVNTASAWAFALAPTKGWLLFFRFCVGTSQAMLMVYSPVWIDEFAPPKHISKWMSLIQAGAPVGITVGYLCSGFIVANTKLRWSWCFYYQCLVLSPCAAAFFCIPHHHINARTGGGGDRPASGSFGRLRDESARKEGGLSAGRSGTGETDVARKDSRDQLRGEGFVEPLVPEDRVRTRRRRSRGRWRPRAVDVVLTDSLRSVLCNQLVWAVVITLTGLYFVVTGVQMWVTDYLSSKEGPIQADLNTVVAVFGACSVSAPIAGVLVGGHMLDRVGGYRGHLDRACLVGTGFAFCAVCCAYSSLLTKSFTWFILWMWLLLFFGGGVVPTATGVLVAAVEKQERGLVTSVAGMTYNLFGYFLGPFACGVVAEHYSLVTGFRVVMTCSALSAVSMACSWYLTRERVRSVSSSSLVGTPQVLTAIPPEYEMHPTSGNRPQPGQPEDPAGALRDSVSTQHAKLLGALNQDELIYSRVKTACPVFAPADDADFTGSAGRPLSAASTFTRTNSGLAALTTYYLPRPERLLSADATPSVPLSPATSPISDPGAAPLPSRCADQGVV